MTLILAAGTLAACDSSSFVPSRPAELGPDPGSLARSGNSALPPAPALAPGKEGARIEKPQALPVVRARLVELILAQPANEDRLYLEQYLRRDTGLKKASFRSALPKENEPSGPTRLANAIRAAAGRSTGAIIVEPIDDPEVKQALSAVEAQGLKVVLLDTPLPAPTNGKAYPYVVYRGFAAAARELVSTVYEDARTMRLAPSGKTLVLEDREKDFYSQDRLDSIKTAMKAAGRAYDLVAFEGGQKGATDAVLAYLNTHPDLTVIIADGDHGTTGAYEAREEWKKTHKNTFVVSGYATADARMISYMKERIQVIIDRNADGYALAALQAALDQMDGKSVAERVLAEVRVIHNPPPFIPPPSPETAETKQPEPPRRLVPRAGPSPGGPSSRPD